MTRDQAVWLAVGGLAVLCLVLLVTTVRARHAWARERAGAQADVADLRARLEELERERRTPTVATEAEFVITGLGSEAEPESAPAADRTRSTATTSATHTAASPTRASSSVWSRVTVVDPIAREPTAGCAPSAP